MAGESLAKRQFVEDGQGLDGEASTSPDVEGLDSEKQELSQLAGQSLQKYMREEKRSGGDFVP